MANQPTGGTGDGFKIFINTRPHVFAEDRISFTKVVALAFPGATDMLFTVTYSKGPPESTDGSLLDGQSVKIQNGMIFDVTATNKS